MLQNMGRILLLDPSSNDPLAMHGSRNLPELLSNNFDHVLNNVEALFAVPCMFVTCGLAC